MYCADDTLIFAGALHQGLKPPHARAGEEDEFLDFFLKIKLENDEQYILWNR